MATPRPRLPARYLDSFMLHKVARSYYFRKHKASEFECTIPSMKTIDEIRYKNLKQLVTDAAGPSGDEGRGLTALVERAAANGKKLSRPTLYQILTKRETASGTVKGVGDELARSIEDALKLERGWMDNDHDIRTVEAQPNAPVVSPDKITELITLFLQSSQTGQDFILDSARHVSRVPASARQSN